MIKKFRRKVKNKLSVTKRKFVTPAYPDNPDGRVLVHIGCGKVNAPGFINVDALSLAHVHEVTDNIADLPCFEDNSVDLVYMCHILEHFKAEDLEPVLAEILRMLRPGGVLRISVPDFDSLVEAYLESGRDMDSISRQLMGGQDMEYNIHYRVFNRESLSRDLNDAGFAELRDWDPDNCSDHDFKDKAARRLKINGHEFPVSLNIEAVKSSS